MAIEAEQSAQENAEMAYRSPAAKAPKLAANAPDGCSPRNKAKRAVAQAAFDCATLQPRLPAEVKLSLGEHTPLEYLIAPLTRRVEHAMREE